MVAQLSNTPGSIQGRNSSSKKVEKRAVVLFFVRDSSSSYGPVVFAQVNFILRDHPISAGPFISMVRDNVSVSEINSFAL